METILPHSAPPTLGRRSVASFQDAIGSMALRRRSFWGGWGGIAITMTICAIVVALLVGWVLLWVARPGGPSISLLTLGCLAFTIVLCLLATLQHRLTTYWRLRQAEAAYLAGVSHNLRTPISAIRTAAQTLLTPDPDEEDRIRLLQAIVGETRRLGLRVDNVLETGRLEIERMPFAKAPFDLTELLLRTCEGAIRLVEARGGTLVTDLQDDVWIPGDPRAIRLLLDNLVDNALKYSDDAIRIEVLLSLHQEFALLRVRDHGIGFHADEATMLFRRFWRGDTGRPGTGLGLSLAQAIARRHGGDIHLHSDGAGKGAIAEVWLPLPKDP